MSSSRATVVGKFIHLGGQRHLVRGVSYGTFVPDAQGFQFPAPETIRRDFASMRRAHINTVRIYTPPSPHILDEAARCDLSVIIGVAWPQHLAFLDDRRLCREIRHSVRSLAQQFAGHPACLLFALGNEIPADAVRWFGTQRVERFLRELYDDAKAAAPDSLFAYVNYPPTEYLDTSWFDVAAFNVYLHRESALRPYFAHLQHIAGEKPLLLTEAGADRFREGADQQAALTSMQLRVAFAEGAAGAVAFTWTDEWWRGGHVVEDWAFGLVDVDRHPKPALHATSRVFASAPFSAADRRDWPRVSVVVCAYNAADTIDECLTSLKQLTYPDFEVIVVNDGSTDATAEIARHHAVRLIDVENGGLSTARNLGLAHATGDVVAYTDADVRADPDWLTYLVQPFLESSMVGAGGPNVPPPDDPWLARCVALAPGGPAHVLLDERTAEHVPGCNMAFRREALLSIGGFDPRYHAAGDDVDVCWRLQAKGLRIGFAPSALVWHRRRPTVRAYWRQQVGYGEAEGWLMRHHPDKFLDGRALWRGRIYGSLPFMRTLSGTRVNAGVWGTASFPSVYSTHSRPLSLLPQLVEWQALSVVLMVLGSLLVPSPQPAVGEWFLAVGGVGVALTVGQCLGGAGEPVWTAFPLLAPFHHFSEDFAID